MATHHITTLPALRQLYGAARERSLKKEIPSLDAHAVRFIALSPFVVPGFDETLRVNGRAVLSTDPADLALCADARRTPALVIRLTVASVYLHCAKAFMRSGLWDASRHTDRAQLPSMAELLRDQIRAFKGEEIEAESQAQMLERYQQSL
jgi:hypothetical protein